MTTALERWIRDFTHAARSLARAPGFTLIVAGTLALAIGASAAIFSIVNVVLLRPLPFPNADRLVHIASTAPGTDQPETFGVPDELYFEYRESVPGIEDQGLYGTGSSTTRADGQVDQLFLTQATPSFFTTLGAQALHGRLPNDDDDNRVVVISHWLWQAWFGSDPGVIGKSHSFANETRTIIGVMRPEFRFPDERTAFWVPLQIREAQVTPGGFGPRAMARLKPGVERAALVAQLEPVARRVQQRLGGPAPYVRIMERHRPVVKPLREQLVGRIGTALYILLGAVAIVFLVACVNVANLFTVRAENRRAELSVRRALGAGRGDLVRPQLTEALLLAGAGGVLGAAIAWFGVPLLVRAAPDVEAQVDLLEIAVARHAHAQQPRAQALQKADPATVRQHEIEQDQVVGRSAHGAARRIEAHDPVHRLAVGRDLVAHRGAEHRVVLDQQDAHGRSRSFPDVPP